MSIIGQPPLILLLTLSPVMISMAGIVEQQQATLHKQQPEWHSIDLPPGIDTPDMVTDSYKSGVEGVWLRIHNVDLFFKQNIGFHALDIVARLTSKQPGGLGPVNTI